jgi:hypothetical protein
VIDTLLLAVIHLGLAGLLWLPTRRLTNPAVLFPLGWGIIFLLIVLAQPLGYIPVDASAAPTFLIGTACFCVGSYATGRQQLPGTLPPLEVKPLVWLCIALHLVLLPIWWRDVASIVTDPSNLLLLAFALRYATTKEGESLGSLSGNYLVVGLILIPILMMAALNKQLRGRTVMLVSLPWITTNFLTNGRAGLTQLFLGLLFLYSHLGRIKLRTVAIAFTVFLVVFGAGAVLVKKTDADISDEQAATSQSDIVNGVVTNLLDYTIQGPILYSRVDAQKASAAPDWDALFWAKDKHWEHADFNAFNWSGADGNVYTIYFAQVPIYGLAGMALFMLVYGLAAGYVWRNAWRSYAHALGAAYLFGATVLSIFTDAFAPSMNYLVKMTLLAALLQWLLARRKAVADAR